MRALAILCFTAGVAHAGSNEIAVGDSGRALRSSSAEALTDRGMLGGGGVTVAHRLGATVEGLPGLELWVGGGFEAGSASGTMFQTMTTQIGSFTMFGMARARYPLASYVHASARVGLGSSRASVELTDPVGHAWSDSGWAALATGALGLELTSREDRRFAFGFRIEGGYTRTSGAGIEPAADVPEGTLRLKMSQTPFGRLDLSGPVLAFSLISAF
jgi:hypothetical protein